MAATDDIKKLLKTDKLVLGTALTVKHLKRGKLEKVYLSRNCPQQVREDLKHYATLASTELVGLDVPNDQLGDVCKKPFSISVIGLLR